MLMLLTGCRHAEPPDPPLPRVTEDEFFIVTCSRVTGGCIYHDKLTGCSYLTGSFGGTLTLRLGPKGLPLCREVNQWTSGK